MFLREKKCFAPSDWFETRFAKALVDALKHLQAETAAEFGALLPAILDKAFKEKL